jgi:type IV pilus assembly protein PilE
MFMKKILKNDDGFSMPELLVVIIIIGILVLLALPKFSSVVSKAKETEAKIQLKHLQSLEEAHFFEKDTYSDNLAAIGFEQARLVTDGGEARYKIEVVKANTYEFLATATAVVDFDKDGTMNVWTINQDGELVQSVPD